MIRIILLIHFHPNGGCRFHIKRVIDRCRTRKLVIFATDSFLQQKNPPQNYFFCNRLMQQKNLSQNYFCSKKKSATKLFFCSKNPLQNYFFCNRLSFAAKKIHYKIIFLPPTYFCSKKNSPQNYFLQPTHFCSKKNPRQNYFL